MHELSLCQGIIDILMAQIEKQEPQPVKINHFTLVVGELHQVIDDNMLFIFDEMKAAYPLLKDCRMLIRKTPIHILCNSCHKQTEINQALFQCSACQSNDFEVISGKELFLESMEAEFEDS